VGHLSGCQGVVAGLFRDYRDTGLPAFYDAALAAYNFTINAFSAYDLGAFGFNDYLIKAFP
jgi:hypothetical protein